MSNENQNTHNKRGGLIGCLARMVRSILCWIGWHEWSWSLKSGETLYLNDTPPDHAKCSRCGEKYANTKD